MHLRTRVRGWRRVRPGWRVENTVSKGCLIQEVSSSPPSVLISSPWCQLGPLPTRPIYSLNPTSALLFRSEMSKDKLLSFPGMEDVSLIIIWLPSDHFVPLPGSWCCRCQQKLSDHKPRSSLTDPLIHKAFPPYKFKWYLARHWNSLVPVFPRRPEVWILLCQISQFLNVDNHKNFFKKHRSKQNICSFLLKCKGWAKGALRSYPALMMTKVL